jgi:hypothetical protein
VGCSTGSCGEAVDNVDEFGFPLESSSAFEPEVVDEGDDEGGGSVWEVLGQVVSTPVRLAETFAGVLTNGQDKVADVFTGGQDAAETVFVGAQDTVENVLLGGQDVAKQVLNPFGLAGLGVGLSVGSVATFVGLSLGGALLADELLAGGIGRTALLARIKGKRR